MRPVNARIITALGVATALLLSAPIVNAKCKFQADTVHRITGEKVLWTEWDNFQLIPPRTGLIVHAGIVEGNQKYLGLRVTVRYRNNERPSKATLDRALVIPADAKVLILLADESIVELHAAEHVVADAKYSVQNASSFGIQAEAAIKYPVTQEQVDAMASQRIKQIRMTVSDRDIDFEFSSKKGSKKMQDSMECIQ